MNLVFHVILKDSCDFMGRNLTQSVVILKSMTIIDTVIVDI